MDTQLAGGLLLKKLKYFEVMLKMFEFLRVWENIESWLVYVKDIFLNCPTVFLDWHNKTRLVPLFFLLLRILTVLKHPKIKLQCLRKTQIWTFESLAHQINTF